MLKEYLYGEECGNNLAYAILDEALIKHYGITDTPMNGNQITFPRGGPRMISTNYVANLPSGCIRLHEGR
jgi:hypothetical protein